MNNDKKFDEITYGFVKNWYKEHENIDIEETKVVWQCKTIQNYKAILMTTEVNDRRIFEVTYNGDKDEYYLDAYVKEDHVCLKNS